MTALPARRTALVLIDLQHGITSMDLAPRSGEEVVGTCRALAEQFRAAGAPVVLVHVGWSADGGDMPPANVDKPMSYRPADLPADFDHFVDDLRQPGDIVIRKHQWGAFTGTDLDVQLRRRGIDTLVVAGIATNFGVESTVRHGWELGYDIAVVEDGCTSRDAALHDFAIGRIFPQISRVVRASSVRIDA